MSLPWEAVRLGVSSSKETILKLERGVEPGWVEIIPLNRVTFHVLVMNDLIEIIENMTIAWQTAGKAGAIEIIRLDELHVGDP